MTLRLQVFFLLFFGLLLYAISAYSQEANPTQISINGKTYPLYPKTLEKLPDIASPFTTEDGTEILIVFTSDKRYSLIPVTVENGDPLDYRERQWDKLGKGRQLEVDAEDFPALARTGLHSEIELDYTRRITGRSIAEITESGRPGRSSGEGFMSHEEDIISVLKGDNRLAKKLGLTHPLLAKPLFHVWNIIQLHVRIGRYSGRAPENIDYFLYNGRKIHLINWGSGHGWQESIFDDEILGMYHIEFQRELNQNEKAFLKEKYPNLSEEQMTEFFKVLSHIHTGEMVPYYIMRYGFYEGHTGYRADPIAIASIFGLRSIEEIEKAFEGVLYKVLTEHFTKENTSSREQK